MTTAQLKFLPPSSGFIASILPSTPQRDRVWGVMNTKIPRIKNVWITTSNTVVFEKPLEKDIKYSFTGGGAHAIQGEQIQILIDSGYESNFVYE